MRTRALNRFERCAQVARWVNHEFDLWDEGAVTIEWRPRRLFYEGAEVKGLTFERGGQLVIQLSTVTCDRVDNSIETLLHEIAHVHLWDTGRGIRHGREFWVTFGSYSDAFDERGSADSRSYSVEL